MQERETRIVPLAQHEPRPAAFDILRQVPLASRLMAPGPKVFHAWSPIAPPANPASLERPELRVFTKLWERQKGRLESHGVLAGFQERMARWWSIETGVIERVYDLSVGATLLLIEQGFVASAIPRGESDMPAEDLVEILKDHRQSLELVMDVVGGARELSVGWIKELHALMMQHQETAVGVTPDGKVIKVALRKGAWKQLPNNPLRSDGALHEYCPPEHVSAEMDRLVELLGQLPAELPEVRAAWLHHAFTQIHPFQDGNGRVARALASIDLVRAGLFPLLVDRGDRDSVYLPSLEAADQGDLAPLVRFFARCEERVLTRAISEAEVTVGQADSLGAVLQAARSKVEDRRQSAADARSRMAVRIQQLARLAKSEFEKSGLDAARTVPDVKAKTEVADAGTVHYFRHQIVELARKGGFWADLREPRSWARLQLRDGGTTDLVVVLHFVGNPSPATCVAVFFLEHRDAESLKPLGDSELVTVAVDPLLLAEEEDEEAQRARFVEWLQAAQIQGLAQWTKYL